MLLLAIFISTVFGVLIGAGSCYLWRELLVKRQLKQVLSVMESSVNREDISLPIVSQLRRRAIIIQKQQEQLEKQLFGWQSLLQVAPIGYLQLDADNQVLWCNETAQRLLQINKWDAGKTRLLLELVRSYELDQFIDRVRLRSVSEEESSQFTNELIWQFHFGYQEAADSRSVWLKANCISLTDGAMAIFIESQQDRVDAATAQERWLGDLAHEIRTPLTSIYLLAETLQAKVTPDLTRWADRILKETNRSIDLVQHFSELSRLETSSTQNLRLGSVDLIRLIDDVWHTLAPIAAQKQIEFVCTGLPQLVLELDPARFTQVLINLFDNSLKYCPDRGHIWIDIELLGSNRVEIDLFDDGSGFTQTDLPHIFERLYRGDVSRQRLPTSNSNLNSQTTGSGLGLAIVRQIILAHQGTIVANNHPTTGGAWFKIILPNN
ncbi:PAS domain-containing sensor histidine kinase [Chamaesiphon sp. VAR_48_metabat_135_sub]|uniref:sensor histidine kinase n=1 Tax=Chamaesiphon sp. VAR_48_metabat_135_sub TaxID=2964699 RepID=UPI00286C2E73|nr:PAS domain-containing sensor histidine kinase [Chamaesiphon sp. VAR_48_metabat_135_sub]